MQRHRVQGRGDQLGQDPRLRCRHREVREEARVLPVRERGNDQVVEIARDLRTPTIYNAIKHAERLGDVTRFGFSESVWRHFERVEGFPRGRQRASRP